MTNTTHTVSIGQILFDNKIVDQGKLHLLNQDLNLVDQQFLDFKNKENNKYSKNNWNIIIPYIIELNVHQLIFYNNPEPMILKEIASINFLQLKWLFLRHNQINNIEPISWLQAPKLQKLFLSNNEFISLKPLQKLNVPNLAELHINGNPFKKAFIDRMKLSDTVDCIALQQERTDKIVACDLSQFAKVKIRKMDLIQIEGINRIRQLKVKTSLSRKFGMIRLSKQDTKFHA